MTKITGSGSKPGSGSISQRQGSPDPDPHQNVMDPQHWLKYLNSLIRNRDPGWEKFGSGIRDKHPGFATLPLPQVLYSYPMVRYTDMEDPMRREVMDVCTLACERHPSNNEMVSA
jgi:hypothetical protein